MTNFLYLLCGLCEALMKGHGRIGKVFLCSGWGANSGGMQWSHWWSFCTCCVGSARRCWRGKEEEIICYEFRVDPKISGKKHRHWRLFCSCYVGFVSCWWQGKEKKGKMFCISVGARRAAGSNGDTDEISVFAVWSLLGAAEWRG